MVLRLSRGGRAVSQASLASLPRRKHGWPPWPRAASSGWRCWGFSLARANAAQSGSDRRSRAGDYVVEKIHFQCRPAPTW